MMKHLDNMKRGFPVDVGGLAKIIRSAKLQVYVWMTADEREAERKALIVSDQRISSDALGARISVLDGLGQLTAGQRTLLRWKVRS